MNDIPAGQELANAIYHGKLDLAQLREKNPEWVPNLSGSNMAGWTMRGMNLSGAIIEGADLMAVDLSGSNLAGSSLKNTDLSFCVINDADFTGANLEGASTYGSEFMRVIGLDLSSAVGGQFAQISGPAKTTS